MSTYLPSLVQKIMTSAPTRSNKYWTDAIIIFFFDYCFLNKFIFTDNTTFRLSWNSLAQFFQTTATREMSHANEKKHVRTRRKLIIFQGRVDFLLSFYFIKLSFFSLSIFILACNSLGLTHIELDIFSHFFMLFVIPPCYLLIF